MGIAAIEASDAAEAAQHVAQVAAEDAAVGVQFVDHDVAEVFKEARPSSMVRQDPGVQHVRVSQNDVTFFSDGLAGIGGRVAVVGENAEAIFEALVEVVEFRELVLREGFGGEEVQRASVGVFKDRVQDGQVVAEGFSGSSGRDDDNVFSGVDGFRRGCLMSVRAVNAFGGVGRREV